MPINLSRKGEPFHKLATIPEMGVAVTALVDIASLHLFAGTRNDKQNEQGRC